MVGFPERFANFFGSSVKDAALSILRPAGGQKRKFDDSAEERSGAAVASSPLKRQATDREQEQARPQQQQPLQNGFSHQHKQQSQANGLPPGRPPFSPGFLTEQRRGSGSKHFTPRQQQQRSTAQLTASAQPRTLLPSPASRQPIARWHQPGAQLSPPIHSLAALQFTTPLPQANGTVGLATELGRTARTNGSVPAETAAAIRRSTLTRGRRVLGPGAAIRSPGPRHWTAATAHAGSGGMAQLSEQLQSSDAQLTAQDLQIPEVKRLAAEATLASSQSETQRLWQQAVSIARQQRLGAHDLTTPGSIPIAGHMPSTPQPAAARPATAANGTSQQKSPMTAAADATPPLHLPPQQTQRLPAAVASGGSGGGGGGALSGFDKFLASLSQQTAVQHLQPHLQPAIREAYRSLDEQRRKAEKERADAELKASHKRFEDLTRGPKAQSLLARAAAALSAPEGSRPAPSRPTAAAAAPGVRPPQPAKPAAAGPGPRQQPKPRAGARPPPEGGVSDVIDLLSSDDEVAADAAPADEASGQLQDGFSADEEGISSALQEAALTDEDDEEEADEGVWVRPLTDEQREQYAEALAPGLPKKLLAKHQRAGIDIRRTEIRCMGARGWLNDEVINIYMALLQDRDTARRQQGKGPKCHFFNSFFVNKLVRDKHRYDYDEVRRWTTEKKLKRMGQASASVLDLDRVIIPVHLGAHWTCAVVDFECQAIRYYDSMGGQEAEVVEALAQWVADEYQNKRQQDVDTSGWPRRYEADIPEQHNGWDCGVFTLQFADAAGRGVELSPPPFSQADMPNLRIKVTADIMAGKVA